jgi:Na+/H+-dicarboxylate symporter
MERLTFWSKRLTHVSPRSFKFFCVTPLRMESRSTATKSNTGVLLGIPLPLLVIGFLAAGLILGGLFPRNRVINVIYLSGTYFPKIFVTFAAFFVFSLLSAAMAKLVLFHREKAGRLFGLILLLYVTLGLISLIYAAICVPVLTHIPFTLPGIPVPGVIEWISQVGLTFSTILTRQPLMQALIGAMVMGYVTARVRILHPIAHGFIKAGNAILRFFKGVIWYYPVMIFCLAIGIPLKFGSKGMLMVGQTVLWVALVTMVWSGIMIFVTRLATRRTFRQILSYYGSVWPIGFGTGGSYDTLAMNMISAEKDLGLHEAIAEVSIVFGTVLNKNCSTMSVLLVTVTVANLLHIPISLTQIILLIPPVLILSLESPGIPGGSGFFMSPIVGVLLNAPDINAFVTTFVSIYSGLIPMLTTAGNTTNDGIVGAFIQDRFIRYLGLDEISKVAARIK